MMKVCITCDEYIYEDIKENCCYCNLGFCEDCVEKCEMCNISFCEYCKKNVNLNDDNLYICNGCKKDYEKQCGENYLRKCFD